MAYTTINKSTDHFDIRTYAASGAGSISDVSFQPDFLWFKNRTGAGDHGLMNAIRTVNKILHSNDTNGEATSQPSNDFTAFTSNGFTYGASAQLDTSTGTPLTWLWKANGTGSANTVGDIASTVSVNTTSGFSIVSYTGNATAGATVGHGLGATPKMIIIKNLNSGNWIVYHQATGNTKASYLNTTIVPDVWNGYFNNTSPTSSLFYLGDGSDSNQSGTAMIAYCFADVQAFSRFGSYVGNGNANGTFVYTGFKPAFVMTKRTDVANHWIMVDNKRNLFNLVDNKLLANEPDIQEIGTGNTMDFLSNSFKLRATNAATNASGGTYIYMAFSAAPLVGTNNVPANAR